MTNSSVVSLSCRLAGQDATQEMEENEEIADYVVSFISSLPKRHPDQPPVQASASYYIWKASVKV